MNKKELLAFIKENKKEIASELDCKKLVGIEIDDLGDVGCEGVYEDEYGDEMEEGIAFRLPKDVDDEFYGEDGEEPDEMEINGVKLAYIRYNI